LALPPVANVLVKIFRVFWGWNKVEKKMETCLLCSHRPFWKSKGWKFGKSGCSSEKDALGRCKKTQDGVVVGERCGEIEG
jgi:hypothetical protein